MQHAPRLQKLRALLRALPRSAGVSALLVSRPADVRYLSGFTGSNGLLLLLPRRTVLLTDSRYTQQASAETHASGARVVIASQLYQRACELALSAQVAQLLYDSTELTVATLTLLQSALLANKPGGTPKAAWLRFLAPLDPWPVPQLRAICAPAPLNLPLPPSSSTAPAASVPRPCPSQPSLPQANALRCPTASPGHSPSHAKALLL
jgi:hypothetical protein